MNKNIVLSITQMKHLESLGLNISDASMYWHKMTINARGKTDELEEPFLSFSNKQGLSVGMTRMEIIPAYTLQDILEKLPKSIKPFEEFNEEVITEWNLVIEYMRVDYFKLSYVRNNYIEPNNNYCDNAYHKDDLFILKLSKNPLEAAYQMLIWCIENNYIKTK